MSGKTRPRSAARRVYDDLSIRNRILLSIDWSLPGPDYKSSTTSPTSTNTSAGPVKSPEEMLAHQDRIRKVARRVYEILEIRETILRLVDRTTLARMLRLETAITASVASVLYRSIHVSVTRTNMTRFIPRSAVYCDSVRILDISPRPLATHTGRWSRFDLQHERFDQEAFLRNLIAWRKKFPNLTTIKHHYPSHYEYPAYTVHISAKEVILDIETRAKHYSSRFDEDSPILPPIPIIDGVTVCQTVLLELTGGSVPDFTHPADYSYKREHEKWADRLWRDPNLDGRLSAIELPSYNEGLTITFDDVIPFLQSRQRPDCSPLTSFEIPDVHDITLDKFKIIINLLGPNLRSLYVSAKLFDNFDQLQPAIAIIDQAIPNLQVLSIKFKRLNNRPHEFTPLNGMPNLRNFIFQGTEAYSSSSSTITLFPKDWLDEAVYSYFSRIGSDDCVYYLCYKTQKAMKEDDLAIRKYKIAKRKS